jgi:hypothetical protein
MFIEYQTYRPNDRVTRHLMITNSCYHRFLSCHVASPSLCSLPHCKTGLKRTLLHSDSLRGVVYQIENWYSHGNGFAVWLIWDKNMWLRRWTWMATLDPSDIDSLCILVSRHGVKDSFHGLVALVHWDSFQWAGDRFCVTTRCKYIYITVCT